MTDAISLIVYSLDASGVLAADFDTGIGRFNVPGDLETSSTVSIVGVAANGVFGAGLGCP